MNDSKPRISEPTYDVRMDFGVKQEMRDGVKLSADIYRPDTEGRFPVILVRTCYSSTERTLASIDESIENYKFFARRGYVFVFQDVRGKNNSDGEFYPHIHEAEDGYDTQEWCGTQEWSNGKVGTRGGSYLSSTQWLPALLRNPHLKTMISLTAPNDPFINNPYRDGTLILVMAAWAAGVDGHKNQSLRPYEDLHKLYKHRPLIELDHKFGRKIPWWKDWIRHSTNDSFWKALSVEGRYNEINVPILHISGWFDDCGIGARINYVGMTKHGQTEHTRKNQQLLVGPWLHNQIGRERKIGSIDFGPTAIIDLQTIELRWFDYWLKGIDNGIMDKPPINIFVMGENEWHNEMEWPLAQTQFTKFYLHSDGRANSLLGDGSLSKDIPGDEPPDIYTYDPDNPVPVLEPFPYQIGGPMDRRSVEQRNDVLMYVTPPLQTAIEVTGQLAAKLYAATDVTDTDFVTILVDIYPNGYAMWLNDGIIRARYRDSLETPSLIEPGKIYEYSLDLWWTSNLFKKGHRIGIEVTSSRFPGSDPNPNTGRNIGTETETICAQQTIYHDRKHPSHMILPVIPRV